MQRESAVVEPLPKSLSFHQLHDEELTLSVVRQVGYANVITLAADTSGKPIARKLVVRPEVRIVDYTGGSMQICFNAQYVLDFLSAVSCDVVSLDLKDEVSQAVMKPVGVEGYDYTYVIMPMRV